MAKNDKEFRELVYSNLIEKFLTRNGETDLSPNKTFSYIKSLGILERKDLSALSPESQEKLTTSFNKGLKEHDFREFVEYAGLIDPRCSKRALDGFFNTLNEIAYDDTDKHPIKELSYKQLNKRFKDGITQKWINLLDVTIDKSRPFQVRNSKKGEGLTGIEFLSLLSGAYYLDDLYQAKKQSFNKFQQYTTIFNKTNIEQNLTSTGFNYNSVRKFFEEGSLFAKELASKKKYEDYTFEEIVAIDEEQRKLTSYLLRDIVRNHIGLPTSASFKSYTELRDAEKNNIKNILAYDENEKDFETSMSRIESFADTIKMCAQAYYDTYGEDLKKGVTVETIESALIRECAEQGAFASKDLNEFKKFAVYASAQPEFRDFYINDECRQAYQVSSNLEGEIFTSIYFKHDGQCYYLNNFIVPKGDLEAFKKSLKPTEYIEDGVKKQIESEEFKKVKAQFKKEFSNNFNNLQVGDLVVGESKISKMFELASKTNKKEEKKDFEGGEHFVDDGTQEDDGRNPLVKEFEKRYASSQSPTLCTANYIYEEAFQKAIEQYSQMVDVKPRTVVKEEIDEEEKKNDDLDETPVIPIVEGGEDDKTDTPPEEPVTLDAEAVTKTYYDNIGRFNSFYGNLESIEVLIKGSALEDSKKTDYLKRIEEMKSNEGVFLSGFKDITEETPIEEINALNLSFEKSFGEQENELNGFVAEAQKEGEKGLEKAKEEKRAWIDSLCKLAISGATIHRFTANEYEETKDLVKDFDQIITSLESEKASCLDIIANATTKEDLEKLNDYVPAFEDLNAKYSTLEAECDKCVNEFLEKAEAEKKRAREEREKENTEQTQTTEQPQKTEKEMTKEEEREFFGDGTPLNDKQEKEIADEELYEDSHEFDEETRKLEEIEAKKTGEEDLEIDEKPQDKTDGQPSQNDETSTKGDETKGSNDKTEEEKAEPKVTKQTQKTKKEKIEEIVNKGKGEEPKQPEELFTEEEYNEKIEASQERIFDMMSAHTDITRDMREVFFNFYKGNLIKNSDEAIESKDLEVKRKRLEVLAGIEAKLGIEFGKLEERTKKLEKQITVVNRKESKGKKKKKEVVETQDQEGVGQGD